ncbi:uncharacterized protein LOC136767310 [Amia ocellicauda]|uniref:uncharacterized protein LOC136767310 n=1 Tax=Amia ocellicauda TaxID=2972642 RepID=UPI003463F31D
MEGEPGAPSPPHHTSPCANTQPPPCTLPPLSFRSCEDGGMEVHKRRRSGRLLCALERGSQEEKTGREPRRASQTPPPREKRGQPLSPHHPVGICVTRATKLRRVAPPSPGPHRRVQPVSKHTKNARRTAACDAPRNKGLKGSRHKPAAVTHQSEESQRLGVGLEHSDLGSDQSEIKPERQPEGQSDLSPAVIGGCDPESPPPAALRRWVIGPLFQSLKSKVASFTEIVMSPVRMFKPIEGAARGVVPEEQPSDSPTPADGVPEPNAPPHQGQGRVGVEGAETAQGHRRTAGDTPGSRVRIRLQLDPLPVTSQGLSPSSLDSGTGEEHGPPLTRILGSRGSAAAVEEQSTPLKASL